MKAISIILGLIGLVIIYLCQQLGLSLWTQGRSDNQSAGNLAQELSSRQVQLDARERDLLRRETGLRERETILKSQVSRYEIAIQESLAELESIKSAQMEGLKQIYEKMEPKRAARILDEMEVTLAHRILSNIREDRAAEIMSRMRAERARLVSERQLKLSSSAKRVNEVKKAEEKGGEK